MTLLKLSIVVMVIYIQRGIDLISKLSFSFFHSLLLVSTRAILDLGEQGKIKKRTYHDWLVQ